MSKNTTDALVGYLFMVMYYIMFLSINMGSGAVFTCERLGILEYGHKGKHYLSFIILGHQYSLSKM